MPNRYDFTGRVALVTGGASGIGAATVARLRAGGARVAVFDLDAESADAELAVSGDVTRSAEAVAAVARVEEELGGLDVLVCCAGVSGESLRTVEEAAALIAFLASEDLSFPTGATFDLSGGRAVY